jgi:pilus assembly protein CpaC
MNIRTVTKAASAFVVFACCLISSYQAWGESSAHINLKTTTPQKLTLTVGKSVVIETPRPVKRVSLAAPQIADAIVITPRQIYLTGKAAGLTNLTLWEDNKVSAIFDLEISPDITRLKEKLHEMLPEEKDIHVTTTYNHITLSGTVSSSANLAQVLAIAGPYAPCVKGDKEGEGSKNSGAVSTNTQEQTKTDKGKCTDIINLIEVGGVQQVMLEVRVSEISRSLLERLGINFSIISSSGKLGLSLLNNLTLPIKFPGALINPGSDPGINISDKINGVLRFFSNDTSWTIFIDALKDQGLLKVLAEPTLITLSGQTANFLAGGEFPILVPQALGTVSIEYKPFGVGLSFSPTVLSNKKISMKVAPEVSELDSSISISIGGFVVPGFTTRRASTVIELADGQSFAIAGLLQENIREVVTKFPVLGDIPVLGALFRSSSFQKRETELIIIVTPHLVKPLDMAKQTLPTDQYIQPDDFEFYLLGNLEGKEKMKSSGAASPSQYLKKGGGVEGDFGHIVP